MTCTLYLCDIPPRTAKVNKGDIDEVCAVADRHRLLFQRPLGPDQHHIPYLLILNKRKTNINIKATNSKVTKKQVIVQVKVLLQIQKSFKQLF